MSDKAPAPLRYPTALLWHETSAGSHFDWLLVDPTTADEPDAPLMTFRVGGTCSCWRESDVMTLTPLPPHRRIYLTYEGPISGNRGSVKRVDEGTFVPILWTPEKKVIDVRLKRFTGVIEMTIDDKGVWTGKVG